MGLNFFKKINRFIKYPEAKKTGQEENESIHIEFAFSLFRKTKPDAGSGPFTRIRFNIFISKELRRFMYWHAGNDVLGNHIILKGYFSN